MQRKKVKQVFAAALALSLAAGMSVPALAASGGGYTVTINNDAAGHTYQAYQIFSGKLSADETILSNIEWGSGVKKDLIGAADALGNARMKAKQLENLDKDAAEATAFAEAVIPYLADTPNAEDSTVEDGYTLTGLEAGYYLIRDKVGSLNGKDDSYTDYIMKIVKNESATPKSVKPSVDKYIQDEADDAEAGAEDGWGETADHAMFESYQYALEAKVPDAELANRYDSYSLVFHDTLATGITYEGIDAVYVDGVKITEDDFYTLDGVEKSTPKDGDGSEWTLKIANVLPKLGTADGEGNHSIVVVYNAHLNENAQIMDNDANKNSVFLEYSNNPNKDGAGNTGKTSPDTVWAFTYKMDNHKSDGDSGKNLDGVKFELQGADGSAITMVYDEALSAYRPAKSGEAGASTVLTTRDGGLFNIVGLDAGTYKMVETEALDGYNDCEDIDIVISATHQEESAGDTATTAVTMTKQGEEDKDPVTTDKIEVLNYKGVILPSTGGMGTTLLYVGGAAIIAGALCVTVVRRKRS